MDYSGSSIRDILLNGMLEQIPSFLHLCLAIFSIQQMKEDVCVCGEGWGGGVRVRGQSPSAYCAAQYITAERL